MREILDALDELKDDCDQGFLDINSRLDKVDKVLNLLTRRIKDLEAASSGNRKPKTHTT